MHVLDFLGGQGVFARRLSDIEARLSKVERKRRFGNRPAPPNRVSVDEVSAYLKRLLSNGNKIPLPEIPRLIASEFNVCLTTGTSKWKIINSRLGKYGFTAPELYLELKRVQLEGQTDKGRCSP
jgi:hypothetical protein